MNRILILLPFLVAAIIAKPDGGIVPGTKFEYIPDDWVCPLFGIGKDQFSKVY